MNNRETILSLRSLSKSSRSKETFLAISLMIFVLIHDISTITLEISSMCSPMKSRHSLTSRSILRNSAGIRIVTAFFISSFGPPYLMIAEFAKVFLSSFGSSAHF